MNRFALIVICILGNGSVTISRDLATPPLQIVGAKLSTQGQVKRLASESYWLKMGGTGLATEAVRDFAVFRIGYDIADFAASGERLWETRVKTLEGELRAILWIHPETEQVYFVAGPWQSATGAQSNMESPNKASPPWKTEEHLVLESFQGEWRATLFSRVLSRTLRVGGEEVRVTNTLYYVEVVSSDSEAPRRVWQQEFASYRDFPQLAPYSFVFGLGDEHQFCVAFLQGVTVRSFVLDLRSDLTPLEDAAGLDESQAQTALLDETGPNALLLPNALGKDFIPKLAASKISIDAVFSSVDWRSFHLTIGDQKLILRYSDEAKKSAFTVCRLTEPGG